MIEYSLYLQKDKPGSPVIDTVTNYGIALVNFPFNVFPDVKDLYSDDWAEESGEDVFFPDKLVYKAYDLDAELSYKGDNGSALEAIEELIDYLSGEDGNGTSLKIYDPITKIGRQKIYFKGFDEDAFNSSSGDVVVFTLKFRVTDPRTKIEPVITGGNVTGLA